MFRYKLSLCVIALSVMAVLASTAPAGWDVTDPHKMHFPQLPDLQNGMNVLNSLYQAEAGLAPYYKFLADDFLCTSTGKIRDVHFWGSWLQDHVPPFTTRTFQLAIFDNIPAGPDPGGFSRPGEMLWEGRFIAHERFWAEAPEPFFDPNQNLIIGQDTQVFQYNILIPDELAFRQVAGTIYWLGIALLPDFNGDLIIEPGEIDEWLNHQPQLAYGWKSSADRFEDDAVWTDMFVEAGGVTYPIDPNWHELIDPRTGESMNLSFVITPEPATVTLLTLGGLALLRRRH